MTRNLKVLGMLLASMFAITAMAAATASAANFHAEVEPTYLTGSSTGNHVFKASGAEVVCTGATFTGEAPTLTKETQISHPSYSGCTFLEEAAAVDTTGCDYELFAGGRVDVECSGSNVIKVTTSACTLSFGSQTTTGGATYTNAGSGTTRDVTVHSSTVATFSKSGPLCFLISGTTGTYTGSVTVKGYSDKTTHKTHSGIWVS